MFNRSTWLVLALAVLAAAVGGYVARHGQHAGEAETRGMVGQPVPAIVLPDLEGKLHALNGRRGHRTVLNFWASWCLPCLQEMPALDEAQQKFGKDAPIVLGIAMDQPEHVQAFLAAHPVSYPILIGDLNLPTTSQKLGNTRQILPYSVLIGADGHILATHAGMLSSSQLDDWLGPDRHRR